MRRERVIFWIAVIVTAILIGSALRQHKNAALAVKTTVTAPVSHPVVPQKSSAPGSFLVRPGEVLATVDGTPITLGDLMPLHSTNPKDAQQMDSVTYHYLLQRAINRQLIMGAAMARGIALTQSQEEQLQKYQAEREQPEPGLISKLTVDTAQIQFELQDEQAFMLQTSLMAASGYSPDVSPDQVQQYYQQHMDQYGQLPDDPQARQQAWQSIEYQIRETLANSVRTQYQQQLDAYMSQLQARASITQTPPMESQGSLQAGS